MKKILFVLTSRNRGGAEKIVSMLYKNFENKYDLKLATVKTYKKSNCEYYPNQVEGIGTAIFSKADIIHSHLFWSGLVVRIRRMWDKNFKWVHTVHYDDYRYLSFGKIKHFIDFNFIFPFADEIIAVSDSVLKQLPESYHAIKIYNAIDYSENANNLKTSETLNLLTVAMLRKEKGIENVLYSAKELLIKKINFKWVIVGDGPERLYLETLHNKLNLGDSVEFVGFQNNLENYFKFAQIYVQPSKSESFGLSILEAMSWSLPIVATNIGNIPNILQFGKFGILSKSSELATNLLYVCSHLQEFSQKAITGFRFWKNEFAPVSMFNQHESIYEKTVKTKGILFVSPYLTHGIGGIQKQSLLQSKELFQKGNRIFFLQRIDKKRDKRKWAHVEIWSVPDFNFLPDRIRGILFIFFGIYKLILNAPRYDVIYAHQLYSPTILGAIIKKIFHKKLLVKVTAGGDLGEVAELKRLPFFNLRKYFFKEIDKGFALNPTIYSEIRSQNILKSNQIKLLTNSVQIPFQPASLNLSNEFNLLYTGRLSKEKNIPLIINALKNVKVNKKIVFNIIGSVFKERDPSLEIRMALQGIPENLKINFISQQKDLSSYYLNANAFILASCSEGMSNSLLEAMSYGLPCVVSNIPANTFLIENNKNGIVFVNNNCESLAKELTNLIIYYNELTFLGVNARNKIINEFSVQKIVEDISREIYE